MDPRKREEMLANAPLGRLMLSMGIPTFIAQLINLLYNIVDRIYIGHIEGCGAQALTGVGLCVPVITLVTAFAQFVGAGGAPLAAMSLGRGEREKAQKILTGGFTVLMVFALILMTVFFLIKEPFLYLFGASDQTFPYADQYLSIYLLGTFFVQITIGLNTFITAQGQSRTAMLSVLIGAVTNIILDPIFIFVLGLGIRGAAIATVISQGISAVWILVFLNSSRASLGMVWNYWKPEKKIMTQVAALGISPFIMASTESLITVVFNRGMQIYGNDLYVGSITIMQSVLQIIFTPLQGFSQGVQPIISYNYGAGHLDRVKKTCMRLLSITFTVSLVMTSVVLIFPGRMAGLFTTDPQLIEICRKNMPVFLAGMTIFGLQSGSQQSFLALGQAKKSLFFALFRKVILLIPLALVLPALTGSVMGIYVAEPISDAVSAIVCSSTFLLFQRSLKERE